MAERPTRDQLDSYLIRCMGIIDKHGVMIQAVFPTEETIAEDGDPFGFAYTVGLSRHELPEFIVAALPQQVAHSLLNDLARRARDGEQFAPGQILHDVVMDYPIRLDTVGPLNLDRLGTAWRLYPSVTALQVTWTDMGGRWPEDPGFTVPGAAPATLGLLRFTD